MKIRTVAALLSLFAATPVVAADDLAGGVAALQRKDYYNAVRILLPLAEAGDARAQLRVASLYYHGHGVAESDADALAWYERAAIQGLAEAQYQTANMYTYGLGVDGDNADADRRAAQWYFVAARQGHRDAQYGLAVLFLTGKGVERSDEEALRWMRKAAAAGHADARGYLKGHRSPR